MEPQSSLSSGASNSRGMPPGLLRSSDMPPSSPPPSSELARTSSVAQEALAQPPSPPEYQAFRTVGSLLSMGVDYVLGGVKQGAVNYVAAPMVSRIAKGDDEYLKKLTGSEEVFEWVDFLIALMPDWLPRDLRRVLLLHLMASSARNMGLKEEKPISTGDLIVQIIQYYDGMICQSFKQVEEQCKVEGVFPEERHFHPVASQIVQRAFPETKGYFSGYLARFLFEIYVAKECSTPFSHETGYGDEIESAVLNAYRHLLPQLFETRQLGKIVDKIAPEKADSSTKAKLVEYISSQQRRFYEIDGPISRLIVRKINELQKQHPVSSFSDFLNQLQGVIPKKALPDYRPLIGFLFGDLNKEPRIPKGLREGITSYLTEKLAPRFDLEMTPWFEVLKLEGSQKDAPFDRWPIRGQVDAILDQLIEKHYEKFKVFLPAPWGSFISDRLGKALLKQVILHVFKNFSRDIETPPDTPQAFFEKMAQFTIDELNWGLKECQEHPSKGSEPLEAAFKTVLSRFLPALTHPKFEFHKSLGQTLYQILEIHEQFNPENLEASLQKVCPGYNAEVSGFMITVHWMISDQLKSQKARFHEPVPLLDGLAIQVTGIDALIDSLSNAPKVLAFSWVEGLLKEHYVEGVNPIESILIRKIMMIRRQLPNERDRKNPEAWIQISNLLCEEMPLWVPKRHLIIRQILPGFLARHQELVSGLIEQSNVDLELLANNPYRGVENPSLNKAKDHIHSMIFSDGKKYPEVFTKPLVQGVLEHFMARSTHRIDIGAEVLPLFTRLFVEGLTGFGDGGVNPMLLKASSVIHPALAPLAVSYASKLKTYLDLAKPKSIDAIKKEIKTALVGSGLEGVPIESVLASGEFRDRSAREAEFYPKMQLIESLVHQASVWIVKKTIDYLKSNDSPVPYLSGIFTHPKFQEIKPHLEAKVEELLFIGLKNVVTRLKTRGVSNENLMKEALNDFIGLFKRYAPERARAHEKSAWIPLVQALIRYAYPNPEALLPVPDEEKQAALEKLENLLAGCFSQWNGEIFRYILNVEASKAAIIKATGSNHAVVFASVIGRIWVKEFIPHMLKEEKKTIADSIQVWLRDEMHVTLSDEALTLIQSTLEAFFSEYTSVSSGARSPSYQLSEFAGEFAEAYILKLFAQLFNKIESLESDKPLFQAFLEKVVPKVDQYYESIRRLKNARGEERAHHLSRTDLINEAVRQGLKSPGLPEVADNTKELMDNRRRAHFKTLSNDLLNALEMNIDRSPFPAPVADILQDLLLGLVAANTLLAIEHSILDNRGSFLLQGYEQMKLAAESLAPNQELVEKEVGSELKNSLARILSNLVAKLPNHPWAPILELKPLKKEVGQQLANLLVDKDFNTLLKMVLESVLPKLVPGTVSRNGGDIEFNRKPKEHILFTTQSQNEKKLIKDIKDTGAAAFLAGINSLGESRYQQEKKEIEGYAKRGFEIIRDFVVGQKGEEDETTFVEELFKWIKVVCEKGYHFLVEMILIPMIKGILFVPKLLLVDMPLYFYFRYLASSIYEEVNAQHQETILLKIIDDLVEEITKAKA